MKYSAAFLSGVLLAGSAYANSAETQCTSPATLYLVKEVIRTQLLPSVYSTKVPENVFRTGTRIADIETTRYESELQLAECAGVFTVDASAGMDADTAKTIEVTYAQAPDLVLILNDLLSRPPVDRVYDFKFSYSSQIKNGQNNVKVGLSNFKLLVTGGLLVAKANTLKVGAVNR